jgi:protein SCO1
MKWMLPLLFVACGARAPREEIAQTPPVPRPTPVQMPVQPATTIAPGPSIYDLPISLRDARGNPIGLDVDRGHPTLIAMFYGSCAVACPALIHDIQQVVAGSSRELRVLLVSFDAARDQPARLRALAADRGLDDRWTLTSATDADARALAGVLGVKYRKLDNGEFFHSATIVALDREGVPVARVDRLGAADALIASLR